MRGDSAVRKVGDPEQRGKARDVGQNEAVFCVTLYGSGALLHLVSLGVKPTTAAVRAGCERQSCLKPRETDP